MSNFLLRSCSRLIPSWSLQGPFTSITLNNESFILPCGVVRSFRTVTQIPEKLQTDLSSKVNQTIFTPYIKTRSMTSYAAVHHGDEYREALQGRHGQQLKLAWKEGYGKDDKKFNPFEEYKIRENESSEDHSTVSSASEFETKPETILLDDSDENSNTKKYKSDGRVLRPASLIASLNAGLPAGGNFAIVDINGSQQKVTIDDLVIVNKLKPISDWAVGSVHTLADDHVLLVGCSDLTLVGLPAVEGAEVDVMVEEITRDATVLVFKKRRRKHSKRKNGFRREVTFLRVLDIRFPQRFQNVSYEKEKL